MYCTERKAVYRLFQPRGVGKITWRKIYWKIWKPSCLRNFISAIGDYFFLEFVKSRLERGLIGFLNDWALDTSTTEQEVLCDFSWPRHLRTLLCFFEGCRAGKSRSVMFEKYYLWFLEKNKFRKSPIKNSFSCDGASINSGWNKVWLLKEDYKWIYMVFFVAPFRFKGQFEWVY